MAFGARACHVDPRGSIDNIDFSEKPFLGSLRPRGPASPEAQVAETHQALEEEDEEGEERQVYENEADDELGGGAGTRVGGDGIIVRALVSRQILHGWV